MPQEELLYLKLQIEKCKLKILFFQFSFSNYFTRSTGERNIVSHPSRLHRRGVH